MQYGIQTPYLALAGLWALTLIGYLLGPETKGKELDDLADEALTEDLEPVKNSKSQGLTTQLVAPATGRTAGPPALTAAVAAAVIPLPLCVGGITCSLRPLGTWRLRHS